MKRDGRLMILAGSFCTLAGIIELWAAAPKTPAATQSSGLRLSTADSINLLNETFDLAAKSHVKVQDYKVTPTSPEPVIVSVRGPWLGVTTYMSALEKETGLKMTRLNITSGKAGVDEFDAVAGLVWNAARDEPAQRLGAGLDEIRQMMPKEPGALSLTVVSWQREKDAWTLAGAATTKDLADDFASRASQNSHFADSHITVEEDAAAQGFKFVLTFTYRTPKDASAPATRGAATRESITPSTKP